MTVCSNVNVYRNSTGSLFAEASSIGLKPGEWPTVIEVDGCHYVRQNPIYDRSGEELVGVMYMNVATLERFEVYND